MQRGSSICSGVSMRNATGIPKRAPIRNSKRIRLLTGVLAALVAMGIAGALLTGCDRTISDHGSLLSVGVR